MQLLSKISQKSNLTWAKHASLLVRGDLQYKLDCLHSTGETYRDRCLHWAWVESGPTLYVFRTASGCFVINRYSS